MGKFTDPLDVRYLNDENLWQILRTFEFHMGAKDSGLFIRVESGDKTDFFSIPWIVRWLIPKSGKGNQAAAIHDKGYQTGMLTVRIGNQIKSVPANKSAIDSMFLDAMIALEVPVFKRQVIYRAVQVGGFVAWNRYRQKNGDTV